MLLFQGKALLEETFNTVQQDHFLAMFLLDGPVLILVEHLNVLMVGTFAWGWRLRSHDYYIWACVTVTLLKETGSVVTKHTVRVT